MGLFIRVNRLKNSENIVELLQRVLEDNTVSPHTRLTIYKDVKDDYGEMSYEELIKHKEQLEIAIVQKELKDALHELVKDMKVAGLKVTYKITKVERIAEVLP